MCSLLPLQPVVARQLGAHFEALERQKQLQHAPRACGNENQRIPECNITSVSMEGLWMVDHLVATLGIPSWDGQVLMLGLAFLLCAVEPTCCEHIGAVRHNVLWCHAGKKQCIHRRPPCRVLSQALEGPYNCVPWSVIHSNPIHSK